MPRISLEIVSSFGPALAIIRALPLLVPARPFDGAGCAGSTGSLLNGVQVPRGWTPFRPAHTSAPGRCGDASGHRCVRACGPHGSHHWGGDRGVVGGSRVRSNFLVTAVPRSGTTFFARVLNGHPDILCGSERFHGPKLSPDRLTIEGFATLDRDRVAAERQDALARAMAEHPDPVIGDKIPRAYLHLGDVLPRFDGAGRSLRFVALIRDVHDVERSWFRRASDKTDASWDRGQYGAFPFIETVILVHRLLSLPPTRPCLVLPYDRLVATSGREALFGAVAHFLGVRPDGGMLAVAEGDEERGRTERSATRPRPVRDGALRPRSDFFERIIGAARTHGTGTLDGVRPEWTAALADLVAERTFFAEAVDHIATVAEPAGSILSALTNNTLSAAGFWL